MEDESQSQGLRSQLLLKQRASFFLGCYQAQDTVFPESEKPDATVFVAQLEQVSRYCN
jgi:hypothetical protein